MDIRHLRSFVAVAEELHFRRAAERLHLAQPPLTRQIRELEQALGAALFERDKRRVELTAAGRETLVRARSILAEVGQLPLAARRAQRGESGMLRIGFISFVAYGILPGLLRTFRAQHPSVGIELHEILVMDQFSGLHDKQLDAVVLRPLFHDSLIDSRVIHRERFIAALPSGHRLLQAASVRIEDLRDEPFITLPRRQGPSFHSQVMGFCRRAGFEPEVVHEARDAQAMAGLVGAGMGVAILPESTSKLNTLDVEYRPVERLREHVEVVLAWRRNDSCPMLGQLVATANALAGSLRPLHAEPADTAAHALLSERDAMLAGDVLSYV